MRQRFNIPIPGRRQSGPRVFLLRAHKTAGQSFNLSLSRAFRDSEISPGHFTWQLVNVDADAARRYRYFQGHVGRPTADRVAPEARLVTMLRDPVARLTSSYFYWRSQAKRVENWNAHRIAERLQSMTLLEYVASDDPVIRRSSWNVQARLLAGADYGSEAADRTQLFGFEKDEDRLIDAALEGIERFSSVGIVDRFDESLAQAYDVLDLPGRPEVVYDNRTPAKYIDQEITEEVLDHARRLTRADEIVVEAARARLDTWAASRPGDHDGD
ncbi:MAG: hypothetical protein M8860_00460 [marine benthic group bacterium]|jgi:hypothetical protein|nr:hypothetical protein [Candidatus Carthagonibacter metallireducens]MCL7975461.1 hypothetical protein [Gemmatimonadota bacterium]MCL7981213.1 hypothetical protein [Gemmatimonadota bacterium]MCL7985048.1 hypothetical protein [Gemmatimonadota bacterium]MCL7991990.1 hypothetical protein [Gemmatimonadota bacterium]